ncbi:beta-lactamase-like protein [Powellomyces hirtus]|nr:beta-lactamase-like protein [Powellomyces hirtus]
MPWFRQGEAWLALNEYEKAIEAFDEAMKLVGPAAANEPAENVRRGRVAQIQKRLTKAKIKMEDRSLGLCLHQLSPGCGDICSSHSFSPVRNLVYSYARKMGNYIYLIENIASKECLLVDACWDIDGILAYAKHKKLKIVGAVVTHYHIDHVGGIPPPPFDIPGVRVDGLAKLLKKLPDASAYVNPADIPGIVKANPEISVDRFISTEDYGTMCLPMSLNGGTKSKPTSQQSGGRTTALQFIHTPGHTPGSQCILVNGNRLLSGDTLFIRSCGRVDFPDSDVMHMYHSLQLKLATLPDDVCIFPGHDYNGEMGLIGDEKREGLLKPLDRETFRKAMADTSADE